MMKKKRVKAPRIPQVNYADAFAHLLRVTAAQSNIPLPQREYLFDPTRKYQFDFAWPAKRVAVEVNGGRWKSGGGRHATDADYWKIINAARLGWRVLPVSITMIEKEPWRLLLILQEILVLSKDNR